MVTWSLTFSVFLTQRIFIRKRDKLLQTRGQFLPKLDSYLKYFCVNIPHTELATSSVYHYSEYAWFESRVEH